MFPIGIMYYFGTNLDEKFAVPDFWPKRGQTHTIPFEKEDINEELERLKGRRLAARARRMELEGATSQQIEQAQAPSHDPSPLLRTLDHSAGNGTTSSSGAKQGGNGWLSWVR